MKDAISAVLAVLFIIPVTLAITTDYTFEFGVDDGDVIYTKDGTVFMFHPLTTVDIPVPDGYTVTYVKVIVNSLSPPKVDYDNNYHQITIKYSWIQVSRSSYTVLVKAVKY